MEDKKPVLNTMSESEQGIMFPTVLLVVTILLMMSAAFIIWWKVETRDVVQKQVATKDIFYAEMGVERAIHEIKNDQTLYDVMTDTTTFTDSLSFTLTIDNQTVNVTVEDIP